MLLAKVIKSLLGKDEKPHIHALDYAYEKAKQNPKEKPSSAAKLLWKRYKLSRERLRLNHKIGLHQRLWLFRLKISKEIQRVQYRSFNSKRRLKVLWMFVIGFLLGDTMSYWELLPGHQYWAASYLRYPKNHWLTSYLLENTVTRNMPDYYKKDHLAQAVDSVIKEGCEEGLDALTWMTLSTYFASVGDSEFSYLGFHMAHLKNHEVVGANSLQPINFEEANPIITSSNK